MKQVQVYSSELERENYLNKYVDAVIFVVNYLRNLFTNDKLDNNDDLFFDLNDMCNCAINGTRYIIEYPKLPDTIPLINETRMPQFHINVDDNTIDKAEYMIMLPNYNCTISDDKFCSFFKDLTVYEAKSLLEQMNLFPKNGLFDITIQFYDEEKVIHNNFFLNIIYMLLKTKNKYDVKRARIFADSLGIAFDFTPYEGGKVLDGGIKKKTPPKL